MQCNFQVGQKVVCVDSGWCVAHGEVNDGPNPAVDQICTVRELLAEYGEVWLCLDEFPGDTFYHYENFRPLVTRKTDISVFTALLTPSKQTESA